MEKLIHNHDKEYVSGGYCGCKKCGAVHKYVMCPLCGTARPDVFVKCEGCESFVVPAATCSKCGHTLNVTLRTFVRRRKRDAFWLLLPISGLVIVGGLCCVFKYPEVSILPFGLAFFLGILMLQEIWAFGRKTPPCPKCGKPLKTNKAQQCFECGHDWH